jgi:hypothetical protein
MSIRVVSTGGPAELTYTWDGNTQYLGNGTFIDVEPGSDLEQAIGADQLPEASAQQLAAASNGAGPGWTSNA